MKFDFQTLICLPNDTFIFLNKVGKGRYYTIFKFSKNSGESIKI